MVEGELRGVGAEKVQRALVVGRLHGGEPIRAGAQGSDGVEEGRGGAVGEAAAPVGAGKRVSVIDGRVIARGLPEIQAAAEGDGHPPEEFAPGVGGGGEVDVGGEARVAGDGVERVAVEAEGIDAGARGRVDDGDGVGAERAGALEADRHIGAAGGDAEELALVGVAIGIGAVAAANGRIEFPDRAVVSPRKRGEVSAVGAHAAVAAREHERAGAGHTLGGRR